MAAPNVLWLSLESVRADHTSLCGYERQTTPFLDSLAQEPSAVSLDPMIAASMWTPASTASLLTGTHLSTHQLGQDGRARRPLSSALDTLPELLSGSGYQTALFSANDYISPKTGLARGFDHIDSHAIRKENFYGTNPLARDSFKVALRRMLSNPTLSLNTLKREIEAASNDLLKHRINRWFKRKYTSDSPLFLYAHIQSPHHPYQSIDEFRRAYLAALDIDALDAVDRVNEIYDGTDALKRQMATGIEFSEETWDMIEALYDAEIRYADHAVRRIVETAKRETAGPLVVVIVGDHGDLFGEYGLIGHNLVLHDGLIRVPGLVVGIDDINDGEDAVTQHIDLSYTVASITGVLNDQFQGRDLRNPDRKYAISQRGVADLDAYREYNESFEIPGVSQSPLTSVRTATDKLLMSESQTRLYKLPDETTNVHDEQPGLLADLQSHFESEHIEWSEPREEKIEFDEVTEDRLRDLGYL